LGFKLSDEPIADFEVLRDVSMATISWLFIYRVHIGATWRIQLNRPCTAAIRRCQITLTTCLIKAKFHYASWFGAGSKLVRSWFELKFGLSSSLLAAN